jgi:sphingomyelin phosphodiesterase acid-like 3
MRYAAYIGSLLPVPVRHENFGKGALLNSTRKFLRPKIVFSLALLILGFNSLTGLGEAQTGSSRRHSAVGAVNSSIPVLMVSDIHFDPFHDTAKIQQLLAEPADKWNAIFATPSSSNQKQAFDALQKQCGMRGEDTPYDLFQSGLQAMHTRQADAKFITVSGDLMAHAFPCRFKALLPQSSQSDYQAFVLKTLSFVVSSLHTTFPHIPVYAALGNNDSACGDYQLDAGSDFLARTGKIFADVLPASDRQDVIKQFAEGGYYSLKMAAPMSDTRILVVNDVFLSPKYTTCGNMPNVTAANAEMDWLKQQLDSARQVGQKVWILGHIPPGIDAYSTVLKMKNVCAQAAPVMFLSSGKMDDLLIEHASAIRLGIFAHTHMDELRLLEPEGVDSSPSAAHSVVLKLVSSISPIDGNNPSFTIARINPSTAVLEDYEVIAASNQTGIAATWSVEYDYARKYHEAHFSPATVKDLVSKFQADREAKLDISADYIRNYFVGDRSLVLTPFWPQYACSLANSTAKSYAACVCAVSQ